MSTFIEMVDNEEPYEKVLDYAYNHDLNNKEIHIMLLQIIDNFVHDKIGNCEKDFLHFYKLKNDHSSLFNYNYFGFFIDFNWIKAADYFLDNVSISFWDKEDIESPHEVPFVRKACFKNRAIMLKLMLEKAPSIMDFYNSTIIFNDHLGLSFQEQKYEVCNVLLNYPVFYNLFKAYYREQEPTFEQAVQKIKLHSIKSKIIDF